MSAKLKELLDLKNDIVGVKMLKDNKLLQGYDSSKKYTFCQFIMKAREGKKLLATSENIACANGASALGFMPVPEKLMSGEFLEKLGSFKKEGGKKTMESIPRFEQGQFSGIALAPLAKVDFDPDIIILETVPEKLMWLSLSTIYENGGRLEFTSSISNGTCVDTTVVPFIEQKLNVTLGCYGCRNATNIPDDHLLAGFPANQMEGIIDSIEKINEKAMPRAREKRAYARLNENE
ncbi:MAG: DUF169 domain-containing protein [Eubacteriales bacterium]|jgi:uncharacterized protein (DUF169 family)|nr:DUF169 domain-containing protein [Eubacteriales bacterium]